MSNIYDLIKGVITQHIGPLKNTPSGYSKRNCMMCVKRGHNADTRERFGIKFDTDSISMNCFNCGFSAGWSPAYSLSQDILDFLQQIGVSTKDVKKIQFAIFKDKSNPGNVSTPALTFNANITSKWTETDLPKFSHTLSFWLNERCNDKDFLDVCLYAESRGLKDFNQLYWTPIKERSFNNRLLLPFTYNGKTVGYTGRYVKKAKKGSIPKYINVMPNSYLFNLDAQVADHKYIILCEGVFDAFFLKGISPLHNTLNDAQAELINSYNKKVILSPHRDKAGGSLIDAAIQHGWAVSFPKWGRGIKDASDAVEKYGRVLTLQSIIESAEDSKFNIKVKRNLDHL